jgi:pimeloyl-ACP methyl ester carboxylesterase
MTFTLKITPLTQFSIQINTDLKVHGEYEGAINTKQVIIFSHGFGVKRDSWGTFNQIGDLFKKYYLIIRFDYNRIMSDGNTHVLPYDIQASMLQAVLNFATDKFQPTRLIIISHSMGNLITGQLAPKKASQFILLAPPPIASGARFIQYFRSRPGTIINETGESILKRSDGSLTYVPQEFWPQMRHINPLKLYKRLAQIAPTSIIKALDDQVITDDYTPLKALSGTNYLEIPGNHDFQAGARPALLTTIKQIITPK